MPGKHLFAIILKTALIQSYQILVKYYLCVCFLDNFWIKFKTFLKCFKLKKILFNFSTLLKLSKFYFFYHSTKMILRYLNIKIVIFILAFFEILVLTLLSHLLNQMYYYQLWHTILMSLEVSGWNQQTACIENKQIPNRIKIGGWSHKLLKFLFIIRQVCQPPTVLAMEVLIL